MTEAVTLAPEAIEAVARRVVDLLADTQPPAGRLVDARELADLLAVDRSWIYDNAERLGAIRLGEGPRGRLRFDPAVALAAWKARDREPPLEPAPRPPRRRTPSRGPELLPIAGRAA